MKLIIKAFVLVVLNAIALACTSQSDSTVLTEAYFGQTPPGTIPEVFAPGLISKGFHEHAIAISPKGDEIFYVMADINYQFTKRMVSGRNHVISEHLLIQNSLRLIHVWMLVITSIFSRIMMETGISGFQKTLMAFIMNLY